PHCGCCCPGSGDVNAWSGAGTACGGGGGSGRGPVVTRSRVTMAGSHSTGVMVRPPPGAEVTTSSAWSGRCWRVTGSTTYSYTRWVVSRSEEHTSELQSRENLVCRLLLE